MQLLLQFCVLKTSHKLKLTYSPWPCLPACWAKSPCQPPQRHSSHVLRFWRPAHINPVKNFHKGYVLGYQHLETCTQQLCFAHVSLLSQVPASAATQFLKSVRYHNLETCTYKLNIISHTHALSSSRQNTLLFLLLGRAARQQHIDEDTGYNLIEWQFL